MISLNKAFKDVYMERLYDRGYRKTKSKYPYLVRRVGEEIFHVIVLIPTFSTKEGYKAFYIAGGVGTVYRAQMPFERNPKYYTGWLTSAKNAFLNMLDIPQGTAWKDWPSDMQKAIQKIRRAFLYEKNNDASLLENMRKSADEAELTLLKGMEGMDTLEKCADWYRKFYSPALLVYSPERYREHVDIVEDSLLNFMLYSMEEYEAIQQESFRKSCEIEEKKIISTTDVSCEEEVRQRLKKREENMRERIHNFAAMVSNPENQKWLEQELEARKKRNIDALEYIIK